MKLGVVDLLETNHDRVPNARLIDRNHFAVVVEPVRFRAQDLHLGTSRRALRRFRLLLGVTLLNSVEKENSLSVKTKHVSSHVASRRARTQGPHGRHDHALLFFFFCKQKGGGRRVSLHTSKSSSSFAPETPPKKFRKKKKIFLRFGLSTKRYEFFDSGPKIALETLGKSPSFVF